MAKNDENAKPLAQLNSQTQLRMPSVYKKREKEAVVSTSCTTAPMAPVALAAMHGTEDCVDLIEIFDTTIASQERADEVLKMKVRSGRYEFKEQIEEYKSYLNPHREALKEHVEGEKVLRVKLQDAQKEFARQICAWRQRASEQEYQHQSKLSEQEKAHEKDMRDVQARVAEADGTREQTYAEKEQALTDRERHGQLQHEKMAQVLRKEACDAKENGRRDVQDAEKRLEETMCKARMREEAALEEHQQKLAETERTMEEHVQATQEGGAKQLEEAGKKFQKEKVDLQRELQEAKEDSKEQLEEKDRALQRQASSSERALKEQEQAAKEAEAVLVAHWTSKLEAVQQSHDLALTEVHQTFDLEKQQLRVQSSAREAAFQAEQAILRASHETSLANVTADAKAREAALKQAQATLKTEHQVALSAAGTQACNRETELKKEHANTLAKKAQEADKNNNDWQVQLTAVQGQNSALVASMMFLENENERLHNAVGEEQAVLEKVHIDLTAANAKLTTTNAELVTAVAELAASRSTCDRVTAEKRELDLEYRSFREHNTTSEETKTNEISKLTLAVEKLQYTVEGQVLDLSAKAHEVEIHQRGMSNLEKQLAEAELSRRELHNTIQELKGNIRVMCRVRPADDANAATSLSFSGDNKLTLSHGSETYPHTFDRTFGASSTQKEVFDNVSGLVQSALDGYKVCIFAYGQTGSGKTYTMQGQPQDKESWGLIPRALEQIFTASEKMRSQGWQWSLKASFVEVYNEVLRDLLREDKGNSTPQCHTIKNDKAWGAVVTNVGCVDVTSMSEINTLMAKAAKLRSVGATDMNAQSSRSHSIFALYITGTNVGLDTELHGALHLVDLAGSERLDKSGATGDRLKETQNINKSLSSLSDVFLAKAENRSHVPFRNSKLTHLMEPCLSGSGKTLMFVNVGPEADNSHETCCSLRFAGQVAKCTTGGKPTKCVRAPTANGGSATGAPGASSASSASSLSVKKGVPAKKK